MRRRKGISVYAIRDMRIDRLVMTHPDGDHVSWLRVPHHGTLSATSGIGSVRVYLDESGSGEVKPPRSAEYLLRCLLPRKNRQYFLGCLEEEFRTVMLPEYGESWARVYYWMQTIQSLAAVGWGLLKKLVSFAAIWRAFH